MNRFDAERYVMPVVVDDVMVVLTTEDQLLIKELGYRLCCDATGLSRSYVRSLASNGPKAKPKKLRYGVLQAIRMLGLNR